MTEIDKTYTKMCNCPEIQDSWEPKVGDWINKGLITKIFAMKTGYKGEVVVLARGSMIYPHGHEWQYYQIELIWRPSQEQLQGMVDHIEYDFTLQHRYDNNKHIGYALVVDGKEYDVLPCYRVATANQLWLAFVMWELHKKKWNGKEWINDRD